VFILEFANKRNLKAIARWLFRRQSWNPFDHEPVEFAELNFNFHPKAVQGWLESVGLAIERKLSVSHFRLAILKKLVPLDLLVGLDSAVQWTGKYWQYSPSIFVRSKTAEDEKSRSNDAFWKCPACSSTDVETVDTGLQCNGCSSVWAKREGIYDFRKPVQ
jgi:ribosomal protein L37AE/L43A